LNCFLLTLQLPPPLRLLVKLKSLNVAGDHADTRNAVIDGDTYMLHVAVGDFESGGRHK
jgi:hypothetical protein